MREQCEWLTRAGIWVPQVSELAVQVRRRGVELDFFPMTVTEAADVLRPHLSAAPGRGAAEATPTPGRSLIQTTDLAYTYPATERRVLDRISMELRAGELTAIAGANGAGKSTLARHLVRIIEPRPGSVWLDGRDVRGFSQDELTRLIGYVFQYPEHQFIGKTLLEDVAFGVRRAGVARSDAEEQASAMLARFGLTKLAPASPFTLSHGEQRRLSVASMLVLGQRALLLDEPTFGQDRRNYEQLLDELLRLADEGKAVVAITHDMRLVAERAARVLVLADGQLVFDGTPDSLFADRDLVERARLKPPPLWQLSQLLDLPRPLVRISQFLNLVPFEALRAARAV
jgi:energy-coupling factor transport system ATP-binding protein